MQRAKVCARSVNVSGETHLRLAKVKDIQPEIDDHEAAYLDNTGMDIHIYVCVCVCGGLLLLGLMPVVGRSSTEQLAGHCSLSALPNSCHMWRKRCLWLFYRSVPEALHDLAH